MTEIDPWKFAIARWLKGMLPDGVFCAAEVGVKQGHLARCWLIECELAMLYLVDRWAPADSASDYARSGDPAANATAEQHDAWRLETLERIDQFGTHRTVVMQMDSIDAASRLAGELVQFDAVFLDADHSYPGRLADLQAWAPLVKPGGLVAGGLFHSSYGGHCGRDALHHYLPSEGLGPPDVLFGPSATWAFRRRNDG